MKRMVLATAAIFGVAVVSPAMGADLPIYTQARLATSPTYDWSGFYAGLFGGGGYGNHNLNNALGAAGNANFTANYSSQGAAAGGEVGYNVQSGAYLVGIEGDYSWSDIHGNDAFALGSNDATKLRGVGTLRARSGFTIDRWLVFFTGGWAYGNLQHTNTDPVLGIDQFNVSRSGLTGGGGLAYALTDNLIGKLEYRYYDLGAYSRSGTPATPNGQLPYSVNSTYSVMTIGVDYKLGGPVVTKY